MGYVIKCLVFYYQRPGEKIIAFCPNFARCGIRNFYSSVEEARWFFPDFIANCHINKPLYCNHREVKKITEAGEYLNVYIPENRK